MKYEVWSVDRRVRVFVSEDPTAAVDAAREYARTDEDCEAHVWLQAVWSRPETVAHRQLRAVYDGVRVQVEGPLAMQLGLGLSPEHRAFREKIDQLRSVVRRKVSELLVRRSFLLAHLDGIRDGEVHWRGIPYKFDPVPLRVNGPYLESEDG